MKKQKMRLDDFLVIEGFYQSKTRAQRAVMAGVILVNEQKIDKPGKPVDASSKIRILGPDLPYVSRGGLKLDKALSEFKVDVKDRICLDVGASTGGFTDCLLQHGAAHVYAVDVGYGEFAWKLRNDPRVTVIEKTNIRYLTWEKIHLTVLRLPAEAQRAKEGPPSSVLHERTNLAVIDVSFISLTKVLPAIIDILEKPYEIIALIKPQFEAGKDQVGKGGIIKDPLIHQQVLDNITAFVHGLKLEIIGITDSPISGADGNKEFLMYLTCNPDGVR
ncbi:MAG: TlyA family RNA methyltransferase [bacterium]